MGLEPTKGFAPPPCQPCKHQSIESRQAVGENAVGLEPAKGFAPTSEETFLAMLKPALVGVPDKHLWAIMKRAVVILAGHNGVYVRSPSKRKGQDI